MGKKNKKIGILTINGFQNYGNVLQNVAVQFFFKEMGYDPETIWYSPLSEKMNRFQKVLKHIERGDLLFVLKVNFKKLFTNNKYLKKEQKKREFNFKKFCFENLKYSKFTITDDLYDDMDTERKINEEYLSFFVGSDQVWGSDGYYYPKMFFLPFANKNKRNSFVASFGFTNIPNNRLIGNYRDGLSNMNNISVREYDGQNIVNKISNRNSVLLLDPVFLIKDSTWKNMMTKVNLKEPFILTYFLGKKTLEYENIIMYLSRKMGLKIISLNDSKDFHYFSVSPDKFLYLFNSASYIVTDSFHGTAFSIIFRKKFLVLDRCDNMINMSSRIKTLLSRMRLDNRLFKHGTDIDGLLDYPDFDQSIQVIESNLESSKAFIENSLKVVNGEKNE